MMACLCRFAIAEDETQLRPPACRLIFFGWPLFLGHVASALVQIPTIIGIPTAVTQLQMAKFALWPFGQGDSNIGSTTRLYTTCSTGSDRSGVRLSSRLSCLIGRSSEALSAKVHGGAQ